MTVKRRDFQKASALIHEFLLKLSEDGECAELRDSLNLALLYMQRYYRLLRVRVQQQQQPVMPNGSTTPSALTQSLRGLSPMTPFRDTPDKFVWKWISVESPRLMESLPVDIDKEHFARIPLIVQAAKTGNNNDLMQLIEKDPDCIFEIDTLGRNALMYAVHFGHLDTIQHLLEQGTDVNATALDGSTVVHIACHDNQHEALEILIHYGANLQLPDHLGRTPIHWACAKPQRECLKLLLDNGVSTKLRDNDGMTPSMWACRMDHIEHFELLTSAENQNGVEEDEEEEEDGFERDYTGKTWIHWSIRRSDPHECLKTLLTEDAANLRDKEGRSAILVAADQGSLAATKIVLEIAGMSCLDHRDLNNRSPLILATMGGHGEVVNCLLSSGADFTAVDNFSATAWDYARNRQLHYCMLILASYIRQIGVADVGGTLNGDEMLHNGIRNDAASRGQLVEEGLGINQLQINGEESQQLFYSSQPVAPRPPTQPVTPRAPKRTPRQSHPPNTPRQSHSPTPRTQHLAVTPRGPPQKRSPSTPVEVREEEQLFEMNERGTSSAGSMSKRLRGEGGGSPNRGMSVMSVESYDDQRVESAGSHRTRPRSAHEEDEPEIPSNSQYIEPVEEGHGEEAESVSIDAMDVSDFDADIEEEVSTRQDPSPNKDYIQQQRQPPPSGPPSSYAPPSPSNHHQAPPPHYQETYPPQPPPSQQQYTAPSVPSSHPQARPPPPYHSGPQHHQPGTSPLLQSGAIPHHQPGDSPQPNSPPYKSYPPPRPPPSRGTNPQHPKPASQQYVPQPGDYVEGPRDEDVVSDEDYDAPVAPVPTPRGKPPSPQHIPAHLSPIPMGEPQKRKKRKKRKDRPDHLAEIQHAAPIQYHQGYPSQPAAPGPIVHPPPTPQRRESSPQRNPPPSPMDKGPTSNQEHGSSHKVGYVSHQGNSQSHGQREKQSFPTKPPPSGLRPPALKVQAQSRKHSDHQEEQSFALDQSTLKVSKAGSSGHSTRPPPLSRSSALPPASSPPSYTLPPHQNRLTNSSDSTLTQNARNRKDEPRKSDILTAAEGRSRSQSGGQRFSHQNGIPPGRGPPPTQNLPMTNSRSPRISAGGPSLGTTRGDHSRRNSPSPPKHKPPHQPPPWSQQQQQQQPNGQLPSSAGPRQY